MSARKEGHTFGCASPEELTRARRAFDFSHFTFLPVSPVTESAPGKVERGLKENRLMSNVLKVTHQEAIRSLHEKGWSLRRIVSVTLSTTIRQGRRRHRM